MLKKRIEQILKQKTWKVTQQKKPKKKNTFL